MKKIYFLLLILFLHLTSFAQIVQLKDIYPGFSTATPPVVNSSAPNNLFDFNGTLLFRATDETNGTELWKTDGTSAGTVLVQNIATTSANSNPANFTLFNSSVYFSATSGSTVGGIELWKTDGTTAGTSLVKDIRVGTASSNPQNLLVLNPTTMIFDANDGSLGVELWKTDGTTAGTVNIIDYPGTLNSVAWSENLNGTAILGQVVSTTGREIYKTDGTAVNSGLVTEVATGTTSGVGASSINALGNIFFPGNSGTTGFELWKTNGTAAGTVLVRDINVGANASSPSRFAALGNKIYFKAIGANGDELWSSDGTTAGTVEVADINIGTGSSTPNSVTSVDGAIYFFASDDATLFDLYRYNGTTLVKLLDCNASSISTVSNFVLLNGFVYFAVDSNADTFRELWRTNGTAAGTVAVASLFSPSVNPLGINNLTVSNGKLFFSGILNDGNELMMFDPATLSNSEIQKLDNLSIYPNPSNGNITINYDFNKSASYEVFNILGKKVAGGSIKNNNIKLSLTSGMYIIKIETDNLTTNKKIIIN